MPPRPRKPIGLSRKTFAILGACILIAAAGVVWALRPGAPPPSLIGGPFHLENAEGKGVTQDDFLGEPFLVYFGYTHCPDICPATLAQIADVMKRLPDKPIKALFITVDPERDTPKLMGDYVSSFDPRIIGLSGSPAEVAAAEKAYRVYARKAPSKDGDYTMDHSSIIYLMDARGAFVEAFNLERPPEEAAAELKTYF